MLCIGVRNFPMTGTRSALRTSNEITHGKWLAHGDAERVWGWANFAGRTRARRRARIIASGAELRPGTKVLEIGCGTGLFTEMLAESGAQILAVDLSPELLAKARGRDIPLEQVQFLEKPFEHCATEGPFDALVGSSVLHHLDMSVSLPIMFSLLRPGGLLSFAEPNMLNPQILVQKNVPWIKAWLGDSPDETAFVRWTLERQLRDTGFRSISVTPFDWLHPATPHSLVRGVSRLGKLLERLPVIREFSGSLYIRAQRPGDVAGGPCSKSSSDVPSPLNRPAEHGASGLP